MIYFSAPDPSAFAEPAQDHGFGQKSGRKPSINEMTVSSQGQTLAYSSLLSFWKGLSPDFQLSETAPVIAITGFANNMK